jgi:hypothetical protein
MTDKKSANAPETKPADVKPADTKPVDPKATDVKKDVKEAPK